MKSYEQGQLLLEKKSEKRIIKEDGFVSYSFKVFHLLRRFPIKRVLKINRFSPQIFFCDTTLLSIRNAINFEKKLNLQKKKPLAKFFMT